MSPLAFTTTRKTARKSSPSPNIVTNPPCPEDRDPDEILVPATPPRISFACKEYCRSFHRSYAIVDLAEYWPYVGISHNSFNSAYSALDASDVDAQGCYLASSQIGPSFDAQMARHYRQQ